MSRSGMKRQTVNRFNNRVDPPELQLANAELRDIEFRRSENDEDIRLLVGFVWWLKRKLSRVEQRADAQRKQLNAIFRKQADAQ